MKNSAKPKKSMVYLVIFEHTVQGNRIKGNFPIQLSGKLKIDNAGDIEAFNMVLKANKYLDAVITDWKELGLQENVEPEKAQ